MGWSCSKKASMVLDSWREACIASTDMSNTWTCLVGKMPYPQERKYFWEASNVEHEDGAVTGSIFGMLSDNRATRIGHFRIEGDGFVSHAPSFLKRAALLEG